MIKLLNNNKIKYILPLLPIIIFSSLVPLIVFTRYIQLSDFVSSHWLALPISADLFAFYKMIVVIGCSLSSLIIMIVAMAKKKCKIKMSFAIISATAYSLLVLLSAVFSDYPSIAFWGAPERYEGAVVLISYMIMFIYTVTTIDNIKKVKTLMFSIVMSSLVIFTIGALQYWGIDIFRIQFFRSLMNMNPIEGRPYSLGIIHPLYTAYSTLYNPNNLALYISLIFPSLFAFFSIQSSMGKRFAVSFLLYICALSLIGSFSAGGYYAAAVAFILLIIFAFPYIRRNIINIVMLTVVVVGLLLITNLLTGNRTSRQLETMSVATEVGRAERTSQTLFIDNIVLGQNEVFIDTNDKDFTVTNENNDIRVLGIDDNELPTNHFDGKDMKNFTGHIYQFINPDYKNYIITTNEDYSIFIVKAGLRIMHFHMTDEGVRVPGINNTLDILRPVERNKFLYEKPYLFSGRGYIWAGMLPLLKDTIIIGNGPDTTFLTYPQHDYIGKINMRGQFNIIIEKPHNYYIQLAHDSGWLSLLILLSLFAYYLASTFIGLIKNKSGGIWRKYSIALMCGATGYFVASIMYDSSIFIAPVFWTLLALGFVLNQLGKPNTA